MQLLSPATMDAFASNDRVAILQSLGLSLNKPEPALICKECRYALKPTPTAVSRHLADKHGIAIPARRSLLQLLKEVQLPDPDTLAPRSNDSDCHPNLAVQSGCQCTRCGFLTTSLDLMRRHISKEHDFGKNRKFWLSDGIKSNLCLQSWTAAGQRKYWIARKNSPTAALVEALDCSPRRREAVKRLHRREEGSIPAQSTTDTGAEDTALASNWIRRTAWAVTFAGVDRKILLALAQLPDGFCTKSLKIGLCGGRALVSRADDERILATIVAAADQFFDVCEDTLQHTDQAIRCWVRGQFPDRPYKAPFNMPGRMATRRRYRILFKRFIAFAVRLYRLDATGYGDSLPLKLTRDQVQALDRMWQTFQASDAEGITSGVRATESRFHNSIRPTTALEKVPARNTVLRPNYARQYRPDSASILGPNEEQDESCSEGSDEDYQESCNISSEGSSDDEPRANDLVIMPQAAIHNVPMRKEFSDSVGELALFFCTEDFRDGQSSSALLVYFSGVLGIDSTATTFVRPQNYTSKLSGLIYCLRLCLLEATLPRFAHKWSGWEARPLRGQLELLHRMRRAYMCAGCLAPMGEFLSLRSYGRAFARTDGPSFRVEWSDDEDSVSWHSGAMSMDQFKQLSAEALREATVSCDRLMYGLQPRVFVSDIRDRMANTASGYSFVQDSRNEISKAYLELSSKACLDPLDGLMKGDDWCLPTVRRFLEDEGELLRSIMLLVFLLGGQAPRATEMLTLECENGPASVRGIYGHAGTLVFVTRHWKARQATNQEFQVARYLPPSAAGIVFKYLVYIRPFTNMLNRVCFGRLEHRRSMFSTIGDSDKPWTVAILSKALIRLTEKVCGVAFGVQIYRQISIAITERHIQQIGRPFNRYDDRTADADPTIVFAWQSGHRPMQRGSSYGIDAAYPDSLQPALLRLYQWASTEWHYFLGINQGKRRDWGAAPDGVSLKRRRSSTENNPICKACRLSISSPAPVQPTGVEHPFDVPDDNLVVHDDQTPPLNSADLALPDAPSSPLLTACDTPSPALRPECRLPEESLATALDGSQGYFVHLPEIRVVVCRKCKYAVIPSQVYSHLSAKHPSITPSDRRKIADVVMGLPQLAHTPSGLQYPTPESFPLQGLPVFEDGISCLVATDSTQCLYITRSLQAMQSHCRANHRREYVARKRYGRFTDHSMWRSGIVCQQLFRTGGWQRLFEVQTA